MALAQKILNQKLMYFLMLAHQLGTLAQVKLLGAQLSTRTPLVIITRMVIVTRLAIALAIAMLIQMEQAIPSLGILDMEEAMVGQETIALT
tara:strand:- start:36 stop:308 length:273 start_codon:yes stop_codon:yes gene_type:complete